MKKRFYMGDDESQGGKGFARAAATQHGAVSRGAHARVGGPQVVAPTDT